MTNIISEMTPNEQKIQSRIDRFFGQINLSKMLLQCNFYKESGIHCATVLKELFSLVFYGQNLYRTLSMQNKDMSFKKNTAYRFLNASRFNWERLLLLIMTRLISSVDRLTGNHRE
ncbi:MAG: hypothetical protein KGZ44_08855, partial [Dethiobacter sp.]|nr:hypothetical protein [Dethiobacter sp.]